MNQQGISFRLNSHITTIAIVIIAAVVYFNYHFSNKILIGKIEEGAINQSNLVISKISRITVGTEEIAKNVSEQIPYFQKNGILEPFLKQVLRTNPILENIHIQLFGNQKKNKVVYAGNSFGKHDFFYDVIISEDLFRNKKAFSDSLNAGFWTEPYYDNRDPEHLLVSYVIPLYLAQSTKLEGFVSCEVSLKNMRQMLSNIKIGEKGYAYIINKSGRYLTHPNTEWVLRKNLFEKPSVIFHNTIDSVENKIKKGEKGFGHGISQHLNNQKAWFYYAPLSNSDWMVIIVYPEKELFKEIGIIFRKILWISALGIFLLFVINMLVFKRMLDPLVRVTYAIQRFTSPAGKEGQTKNEIKMLAESLEDWQSKYGILITEQTRTASEKLKFEKDLETAREIQFNIIPSGKPVFANDQKIDLYAILNPAETVGGDLYDYFFIDNTHLLIAIGDVSGKGIPASLFMAIASTLIKTNAKILSAKEIVTQVNRELSSRNSNQYFVTLFLGVLNIQTGVLDYCNAAHNFPYILHEEGTFHALSKSHGLPLGIYKDKPYKSSTVDLKFGDSLIMYTDGVINSRDLKDQHYGTERLENNLQSLNNLTAEETVSRLLQSIKLFEGGSHQSDDITILAVKYLNETKDQV